MYTVHVVSDNCCSVGDMKSHFKALAALGRLRNIVAYILGGTYEQSKKMSWNN